MWQFARLAVRPNDSDPWTVNIAIPDMQLFSLPQTTENKAEMETHYVLGGVRIDGQAIEHVRPSVERQSRIRIRTHIRTPRCSRNRRRALDLRRLAPPLPHSCPAAPGRIAARSPSESDLREPPVKCRRPGRPGSWNRRLAKAAASRESSNRKIGR